MLIEAENEVEISGKKAKKNGTPDEIRTHDLLLRRQTLYPAELRVQPITLV